MSLADLLSAPLFAGEGTDADLRFDVAIGGRGYMIDMQYVSEFGRQTVPLTRQQSDSSDKPGEQTLNPEGLWPRALEDWSHGAGQEWFDKPDSDPRRFYTSKGVDPWTRYALTLLPGTTQARVSGGSNQFLAVAGGRLYASSAAQISATGVGTATLTAVYNAASPITSLASDGTNVYAGVGTGGVLTSSESTFSTFTSTYSGTADLVRYLLGRLIVASGKAIYNVTEAGAIADGTELLDHPNPGWTWTDAGEGQGRIYLSGYAGDKSLIYRTTISEDGLGMEVAVVAGSLPDGEIARSITGYLGYMVIGTDRGVRFAISDANGDLTIGSVIETPEPVLCAEGQDRFVWYGLTNYDDTSTGLGRLDLQSFTNDLTPAYASDLMADGQGTVQSVVTYLGERWFTVNAAGVFRQSGTVPSGTLRSGKITYGIPNIKTAVDVTVRHDPLPAGAQVRLSLSTDEETWRIIGDSDTEGTTVSPPDGFSLNQETGTLFELAMLLTGGVTLRRVTLLSDPSSERTEIIQVPILLFNNITLRGEVEQALDVQAEFTYLRDLNKSRRVVTYQEAGVSERVVLDDFTWKPYERTDQFWTGTFLARLKTLGA